MIEIKHDVNCGFMMQVDSNIVDLATFFIGLLDEVKKIRL